MEHEVRKMIMSENVFEPTDIELKEYLAYKTEKDVLNNFEEGLRKIEKWNYETKKPIKLIAGAMVTFDKGIPNILNKLAETDMKYQYVLLSEVTAEYRRKTKSIINFDYICTPHLLAKEIFLPDFHLNVSKKIIRAVRKKKYLVHAFQNLIKRHINMEESYALIWVYYADLYIKKLLKKVQPQIVILWNEFYAFHNIFFHICRKKKIKVYFMEFGCIPGTVVLEKYGQQGESYPARYPQKFKKLSIKETEFLYAKDVCKYIYITEKNRNLQPLRKTSEDLLKIKQFNSPIVTYMGQNDYESGMYPYTRTSHKYHSPIFKTTLEGLEYLKLLAIKNNWYLVYKPHPIIVAIKGGEQTDKDGKYLTISKINIHELIDCSDVIITILSQSAYISLFREKPVVLLGYMQLHKSGCVYEALKRNAIEKQIRTAIKNGYTYEQKHNFYIHVARILKYYLIDDYLHPEFPYGMHIEEAIHKINLEEELRQKYY